MYKKLFMGLLFITTILFGEGFEEVVEFGEVKTADIYFENQNYLKAIELYKLELELEDENSDITYKIAECYREIGDFTESKKQLLKLIKSDENYYRAYFSLGKIFRIEGKDSEAIDYFIKYVEGVESLEEEQAFYLGNVFMKYNYYEKAYLAFKKDGGDIKNIFGMAVCLRMRGYYKKARVQYKNVILMDSEFSEAYLGSAISSQMLGDYTKAIKDFKKYLEFKKDENVYVALVNIYIYLGRKREAKLLVKEGIKSFPKSKNLAELSYEIAQM